MKTKIRYISIGFASATSLFLLFGLVTDLIPNPFFLRMVPIVFLDYFFLTSSSLLLGSYISINLYNKNISKKCDISTYSGGVGSFLAFGCPVCNKILLILFGATTLLTYFEPYRHLLGFISLSILSAALYFKVKKNYKLNIY